MYDVQGNIGCATFYDNSKVLLGVSRSKDFFHSSVNKMLSSDHKKMGCISIFISLYVCKTNDAGSLHELWLLSVPDKLLLAGRSAGLVKNRDFNLVAAGYTCGPVKRVCYVAGSTLPQNL